MLLLECHQAWLAFFLSHLTEMVSFQQLASSCGCGISIVSSFGSLGHSKVIKVITYLCGCQLDWSQTICFLCISAQPLRLIRWAVIISSGSQQQPMYGWLWANKQVIATCLSFLSVQQSRHDADMYLVTSICLWVPFWFTPIYALCIHHVLSI